MEPTNTLVITVDEKSELATIHLEGDMELATLSPIEHRLSELSGRQLRKDITVQMRKVQHFDSAAALMLMAFEERVGTFGGSVAYVGLSDDALAVWQLVQKHRVHYCEPVHARENWLALIGKLSYERFHALKAFLDFFGQASYILMLFIKQFRMIRYKEIIFEMYESGIKALGIVALTTFLIGVVVAYQSAVQLKLYGANIFIVDMIGIAVLRELAPLITAIVVAGRSGSAYAAQIGVMKITEELDAMRTMGFDPFAFLVLPRMIALTLMMPLMIFFADVMGVMGGMLIANVDLGISLELFLERFNNVVDIKHYFVGIVKGPFFAMLIATIGIYRGMMVKNDTQSIGLNTTKSVVETIFAVIICDALFSIMFTRLGI